MFVRWLFQVFPRDLSAAWRLLRRDVLLWVGIAVALSAFALTTAGGNEITGPPGRESIARIILAGLGQLAVLVLVAVKLGATDGRTYGGLGDALAVFARRSIPLFTTVTASVALSAGLAVLAKAAVLLLLRGTPFMIYASDAVGAIVFVSMFARFAFVPFIVVLDRHELLKTAASPRSRSRKLAVRLAWPLLASSRMVETGTWAIVPYVVMVMAGPAVVSLAAEPLQPATMVIQQFSQILFQAVLYLYYRDRRSGVFADTATSS